MPAVNLYSLPPFMSAMAFFALGLLVVFSRWRSPVNRAYALWCLTTVIWQGTWVILFNSPFAQTYTRGTGQTASSFPPAHSHG